jgi:elongation factor G
LSSTESGSFVVVEAEVPPMEMFGYANVLRSLTQGKGQFQMSFNRYAILPDPLKERLLTERQKKRGK